MDKPLIPAEIRPGDGLYEEIYMIASYAETQSILDIGASSGEGSTAAIVKGIFDKPRDCSGEVFAIEPSPARYSALKARYEKCAFVHPVWGIAAGLDQVASYESIRKSTQHKFPVEQVLGWLAEEQALNKENNVPDRMIERICGFALADEPFDLVVIDGSEFTADAELDLVWGARHIALDDICVFKNARNYARLLESHEYGLRHAKLDVRNGWAVFYRRGKA
jgi:hypothetical protein